MAKVALLIGVSEYEPGLNPLPAAVKDIEALQRVLKDSEMGGFDEVKALPNPDRQTMESEIENLFAGRDKEDLVLLFFSGHGIKDDGNKLYFATRITRKNLKGELIRSTAVPANFVQEIMNNSRAKRQTIILDCCFSGAFDPALHTKDDGSVDLQSLGAEGRVVLTSSSSTQYSFEQQGSDLSIYTRYLVEGIETGAGDRNEDGFVSVLELHEYAASKVQETAPKMTPKIIVLKDKGFEIVLSKARVTDPKLRYRKAASRYANAGTIRPAGRAVLNTLRQQLGLTSEEAAEIETEVLRPYQERLANLQTYREALIAEAEHEYPLSEEACKEVNMLQELLGLRDADILAVKQEVEAQFAQKSESYQQNLAQYKQVFIEAIQREFPLNQQARQNLENLQKSLGLRNEDITLVEQPLLQQAEIEYQEKLRQEQEQAEYENQLRRYEQNFAKAVEAEYPLKQTVLNDLKNFQQQLNLKDEDVARVERTIRERAEADLTKKLNEQKAEYESKLRRYEQEFANAVQAEYPLSEVVWYQLKKLQQQLHLNDEDVVCVERTIRQPAEAKLTKKLNEQKAEYESKLQRYELDFAKAVEAGYPSQGVWSKFKKLQQQLHLKDEDVARVEQAALREQQEKLKQQKAEYESKLRRYEQEFAKAVQAEYPPNQYVVDGLKNFQQQLGLKDEDVARIERPIRERAKAKHHKENNISWGDDVIDADFTEDYVSNADDVIDADFTETDKDLDRQRRAYNNHQLGQYLYNQGHLDEAIAAYREAIQFSPNQMEIYLSLGMALQDQGKLDEAITAYRKIIQIDPNNANAHYILGAALDIQGKLDEAIAAYRKAIQINPNIANNAHKYLGDALKAQGKLDEAITAYRKAILIDPNNANTHNDLAIALYNQGKLDEAIAAYRKAIQINSNNGIFHSNCAIAHNDLGFALFNQGKLDEAIAEYRKAIELDPNYANPHNNLGAILHQQGKLDEAIAEYRKAIQIDPTLSAVIENLEAALKAQGEKKKFLGLF
ncbi:hypothetical protein NIES2100_01930 [Calothrix sp. NIES-2100]|uniref:tetratricopeptide repeat protein n=1 Tax=Calothrix sp. NIES-2100 TaxID=1954172 RepID=UPI000B60C049|nr:hypothetical protein NIES2100_01930 [Calothrix sp. NIES-2100]